MNDNEFVLSINSLNILLLAASVAFLGLFSLDIFFNFCFFFRQLLFFAIRIFIINPEGL